MEFSLQNALVNDVVCQKRTGRAKQFVIMRGPLIYKGPYSEERLRNLRSRSEYFRKWNTPLIVHPNPDTLKSEEGPFVTYQNLAEGYPVEAEPHTESFTGRQYRVLKRSGLLKVGDTIKTKENQEWILAQMPDMLLALITTYVLSIGDQGLYNMLVDIPRKKIYLIDYDENRGGDRDDELFYYSKHPAKAIVEKWLPLARACYPGVIMELKKIAELDPVFAPRVEKAISLMTPTIPLTERKEKPVTLQVVPTTAVGKMHFGGLFAGTTTFSGFTLDVVKSAVQKYIRRGMVEKAIMASVEMFRLVEVGGRAAQTNLFNRLAIIAVEDIGPANLPLVAAILERISLDKRDLTEMVAMVHLMCTSEKSRIGSHLWRAYTTPEGRALAEKKGIKVDTVLTEEDMKYLESGAPLGASPFWKPGDPEEIRPYAEIFYRRLQKRDPNAVAWAYYYLQATEGKKVVPRNRRTNPAIVLWEMLATVIPAYPVGILQKAYFDSSEPRPFLMAVIAWSLYNGNPLNKEQPFDRIDLNPAIAVWTNAEFLQVLLSGNYTFEVDNYVIDKHTAEGKRRGKDRKDFVEEGAFVANVSPKYTNTVLEEIYRES